MAIDVKDVKDVLRGFKFWDVRVDRLVHASGFTDQGSLLRFRTAGCDERAVLQNNQGVEGPLMAEVGYGSRTIRVRFFRGNSLIQLWDLQTSWSEERLTQWATEFGQVFGQAVAQDDESRQSWAS